MLCITFITTPTPGWPQTYESVLVFTGLRSTRRWVLTSQHFKQTCASSYHSTCIHNRLSSAFVSLKSFCHSVCSGGTSDHPAFRFS